MDTSCALSASQFSREEGFLFWDHTLACFADITLDDLEILYSPRAYIWLWNMKFQRFNFPHIPATHITFVHAGGIVISDAQPPIFFCTLS